MKKETISEMGSIKIHNETMACFFNNGFGDCGNIVIIDKKDNSKKEWDFLGHFTVKTEAYLSYSDCDDSKIHKFGKGRYFVYLIKPACFFICKEDEDLHA